MTKMRKKWIVVGKSKKLPAKLNKEDVINILLANRDLNTDKKRREFFNSVDPTLVPLKDVGLNPKEVGQAIGRLIQAKDKREKIVIFGDYDADGVCATAILWETLYRMGFDVSPYIPDRFSEGYGLKSKSIQEMKKDDENFKVLLTVDNGIVANDAVAKCNELGIDVIITDHHEPGEKYPEAHSIIHTQQVSGAAVAWFFAREISNSIGDKKVTGLDLAAIGTISDQMPLFRVNRSIVKYGLEILNENTRLGLSKIYEEAGIKVGEIDSFTIGFVIGPRINAMGRLEHAIESLRLLCTTSSARAKELASRLSVTNTRRQNIVSKVLDHAKMTLDENKIENIIVIADEKYHEGVVGLAASKLVEEFYRPSIVFSMGKKYSKASARSVEGFNIIKAIRSVKKIKIEAGGHPMAAGVTILTKDLVKFKNGLAKYAMKHLTEEMLIPTAIIDIEIDFTLLDWDFLREIKCFKPTGAGNSDPIFITKNVEVWNARTIGKEDKHLKLKLTKNTITLDGIGFGLGNMISQFKDNTKVDIVYCFEDNNFNGMKSLQIRLLDIIKIYE
ncbi:single-stranded-DNA-specific exonuclease RecJ [Candidatus Woesebacteria bacterium]|nr:MAG: single-stranded-DNA-specific exonuclease RecJ [Candidatus Woesebacteria bacterium]